MRLSPCSQGIDLHLINTYLIVIKYNLSYIYLSYDQPIISYHCFSTQNHRPSLLNQHNASATTHLAHLAYFLQILQLYFINRHSQYSLILLPYYYPFNANSSFIIIHPQHPYLQPILSSKIFSLPLLRLLSKII